MMTATAADAHGEPSGRRPQGREGVGPLTILLLAVAIMIAIGVWMSRGPGGPTSLYSERSAADRLLVQLTGIRTVLESCTQQYPAGNNGVGGMPAFPGGVGVGIDVLTCPGAPATRAPLWQGAYGLFLQPAVPGFTWSYTNDAGGVRITATGAAPGHVASLQRIAQQLGSVQASVNVPARALTVWVVR